jgi:hypothetical protein
VPAYGFEADLLSTDPQGLLIAPLQGQINPPGPNATPVVVVEGGVCRSVYIDSFHDETLGDNSLVSEELAQAGGVDVHSKGSVQASEMCFDRAEYGANNGARM